MASKTLEVRIMGGKAVLAQEPKQAWGDRIVEVRKAVCSNKHNHGVSIVRYEDGSIWVYCPNFGYIGSQVGCKITKGRCRYFKAV